MKDKSKAEWCWGWLVLAISCEPRETLLASLFTSTAAVTTSSINREQYYFNRQSLERPVFKWVHSHGFMLDQWDGEPRNKFFLHSPPGGVALRCILIRSLGILAGSSITFHSGDQINDHALLYWSSLFLCVLSALLLTPTSRILFPNKYLHTSLS